MKQFHTVALFLVLVASIGNGRKRHEHDEIISQVRKIVNGSRAKLQNEIPEDLNILAKFYNNPQPSLYSKDEISLTCLGWFKSNRKCNQIPKYFEETLQILYISYLNNL